MQSSYWLLQLVPSICLICEVSTFSQFPLVVFWAKMKNLANVKMLKVH